MTGSVANCSQKDSNNWWRVSMLAVDLSCTGPLSYWVLGWSYPCANLQYSGEASALLQKNEPCWLLVSCGVQTDVGPFALYNTSPDFHLCFHRNCWDLPPKVLTIQKTCWNKFLTQVTHSVWPFLLVKKGWKFIPNNIPHSCWGFSVVFGLPCGHY